MNQKKKLKSIIFGVILSQFLLTACGPGNIKEADSEKTAAGN